MIRYKCDICGRSLEANDPARYIVRVEAFAAAGPLEITEADLKRDHKAEIKRLIDQLKQTSPDEVEDQVYRAFRFDLCGGCHRNYIGNPLGR